jgi:hypothetical protein
MMDARTFAAGALGIILLSYGIGGQAVAQYRNFALGSNVATVANLTDVSASEAKTIHQRPALLQDLEWRPSRWTRGSMAESTDPVERVVFSFYNDQLFRLVVDYSQNRTAGMTDADMIEAISTVYGPPATRSSGTVRVAPQVEPQRGAPLARWGDAMCTVVLYRGVSFGEGFRLIVTESALDDLARKATIQGARLDQQDAPRVEAARLKQQRDDRRAASDKARVANKAVFRP